MIWHSSFHQRIAQAADFTTVIISYILTYFISILLHSAAPSLHQLEVRNSYLLIMGIMSLIFIILFDKNRAYSYQRFTSLIKEYSIIFRVVFIGTLISIAIFFLLDYKKIPRNTFIMFFVVSLFLFMIQKSLLYYISFVIRKGGKNRKRIILVGTGTRAEHFISVVKNNFKWGLDIIGMLTSDMEKVEQEF
jgi:FlaA1/EpsC-like NDP-sugar epimerase